MNSTTVTQNQSDPLDQCSSFHETTEAKVAKTLAYAVIMLMSLFGNSTIMLVIFKTQILRNTTSYLIANMAVSDLLLPIFAMPRVVSGVYLQSNRWIIGGDFGLALCKLIPLFQDISTAVSTQSLVLITIDRFYSVFYPVKAAVMGLKSVKIALPFTWLIAIGIHSPYFYIYRFHVYNGEIHCLLNWSPLFDNLKAQKFYFVVLSVLLFILPLSVIACLYTAVILRLKHQKFPGHYQSENARKLREKRNNAVLKLCIVIVLVFIVCWAPFVTFTFLKFFFWETLHCGNPNSTFIVHFIAHSISAVNPCIYFLFSSSYRQGLRVVFPYDSHVRPRSRVLPDEIEQLELRTRARTFSSRVL